MSINFTVLQLTVQQLIDSIAAKNTAVAKTKWAEAQEILEELHDFATEDEQLIEISKYQVLLNRLYLQIHPEQSK